MPAARERLTTKVSSKGQVGLPKALRDRHGWTAGSRLTLEETPQGVLMKRAAPLSSRTWDEVFEMMKYDGPPVSLQEMDEGVLAEARRRK